VPGSSAHEATIIGDTVVTRSRHRRPSINPLIKVMNLVSVLIAPARRAVPDRCRCFGPDPHHISCGARDHRRGRRHLEAAWHRPDGRSVEVSSVCSPLDPRAVGIRWRPRRLARVSSRFRH